MKFAALTLAALFTLPIAARSQTCAPKVDAAHLVDAGKVQMSINPTLPPQQFVDEKGELQGLNVELGREIGKRLCLETVFVRMDFPGMIPGLRAARFDAIDTGLFWTDERSKILFLVPYAQQAISVFTLATSPLKIASLEDLSGHSATVESNTYQARKSHEVSDALVAAGKKPIDLREFATASESMAALRAGQVEASINIDETATAMEKRGGVKVWVHGLVGSDITFAFRDGTLAKAAAAALTEIRADGTYDKLFDKFGMTRLPGTTFAIRGPGPS